MVGYPDFYIVGAPKCGTTALYRYLGTHPSVFMPKDDKEPHFFAMDLLDQAQGRCIQLDDYKRLFAGADTEQLVGEASVFYLYSAVAISRILEVNSNAKFIAMVRNPVEMAQSLHSEYVRTLMEDVEDFEQAWRLQNARSAGRCLPPDCFEPKLLQYKDVCSLAFQMRRFLRLVPPGQSHIVVLDDLRNDPRAVYKSTLEFLGLADDGRKTFERVHANATLRSRQIATLLVRARSFLGSAYLPLRRVLHGYGFRPYRLLWNLNTHVSARKPIRSSFLRELQRAFADEIRSLEIVLGRSFTHWPSGTQSDEADLASSEERGFG